MHNYQEHSYLAPRNVKPLSITQDEALELINNPSELAKLGLGFDSATLEKMGSFGMDSIQALQTTASIATPIQFLQAWLPGFVAVTTAARKIDELVGIQTFGSWEDEEVVQGVMEVTGTALPYGDYNNVPLSSWNTNFERRTNVRFEEGLRVGVLEEKQAARMRVDSASSKRSGAALALEIQRNRIGFYGFNNGENRTYGFLNDPSLPAYVGVASNGTTTQWTGKTFLQITADLRTAFAALRTQSQDIIDPSTTPITLAISTNRVDFLTVTSDFGISVREWLKQTYPNVRVVSAPELNSANGGANVFYAYAEQVADNSTDGGRVWTQPIASKFQVVGVQKLAKAYEEDYSNCTAGVMLKRPWAVVRYTGI